MDGETSESAVSESDARKASLDLASLLGYTAGAVALLQSFIVASSAIAHQADILALQRGLLAYRDNSGGPWLDPQILRVTPLLLTTYLSAALSLAVTVGLAWYAGRVAAGLGGDLDLVSAAGRRIAWISWIFWAVASIFSTLVLRADGTISWVIATEAKLTLTPITQRVTGLYVNAPDLSFGALQLVFLLLQLGLGLALGLYCATLAAERGAERAPRSASSTTA